MRQNRKWIGMILGLSLFITSAGILSVPENVEAREADQKVQEQEVQTAEEDASGIRLTVGDGQKTPQYNAGQEGIKLEIKVTNQGDLPAKNVRISPVIENPADWPFETSEWNYEKKLEDLPAGQSQLAVYENLKVAQNVKTATYPLKFQIDYRDGENQEHSVVKTIYVKTTEAPKEEEKKPENKGDENAADANVSAAGEGGVYNAEPVSVGGSSNASVPRVIVSGFSTEPGEVNAGTNFKLIIHVKNTSKRTAVSNMLFDLQAPAAGTEAAAEAPAFLPASGGSSIYLDKIPAGGTKDISIELNARADLVQKPYSIEMSIKYEDSDAAQYESASSLAIPVKQAARFEFSELEISPDTIQVGEEANITCSLYNTGRTKLYNVKARFEGAGISAQEVFVGNVDSGATGTIDGMLVGESEMTGDTKCKMIVSYEDESGKQSTTEQEFQMEVLPAVEEDMEAMAAEMPEEKSLPILPIILVVLIAAAAVAAVIIRQKKKKQSFMEEEDLLDEVDRFTEDE